MAVKSLWHDFLGKLATRIILIAGLVSSVATFVFWPRQLYWTLPTIWSIAIAIGAILVCREYRVQIGELEAEIAKLKQKPYSIEHAKLADEKLRELNDNQRALIKLLLHQGRTEKTQLVRDLGATEGEVNSLISALYNQGTHR